MGTGKNVQPKSINHSKPPKHPLTEERQVQVTDTLRKFWRRFKVNSEPDRSNPKRSRKH